MGGKKWGQSFIMVLLARKVRPQVVIARPTRKGIAPISQTGSLGSGREQILRCAQDDIRLWMTGREPVMAPIRSRESFFRRKGLSGG
jgi:hypothetical protein